MSVTLYSTNCPKCQVLETKLKTANVDYELVTDEDLMIEKGFMSAPILEVDGEPMEFGDAIRWVNTVGA